MNDMTLSAPAPAPKRAAASARVIHRRFVHAARRPPGPAAGDRPARTGGARGRARVSEAGRGLPAPLRPDRSVPTGDSWHLHASSGTTPRTLASPHGSFPFAAVRIRGEQCRRNCWSSRNQVLPPSTAVTSRVSASSSERSWSARVSRCPQVRGSAAGPPRDRRSLACWPAVRGGTAPGRARRRGCRSSRD